MIIFCVLSGEKGNELFFMYYFYLYYISIQFLYRKLWIIEIVQITSLSYLRPASNKTITASLHEKRASHCFGLFIMDEAHVQINYRVRYWPK